MILLDTNILIDLAKNPLKEHVRDWFFTLTEFPKIPSVVAGEIFSGTKNKIENDFLEKFLSEFDIVTHSSEDQIKAVESVKLYKLKFNLGYNDALIAETAKRLGATLYTLNEKHFKSIPGLSYIVPYHNQEPNLKENIADVLKVKVTSVSGIDANENHFFAKVRVYIPLGQHSSEKVTSEKYKKELENKIESLINSGNFKE